ncbi:MAG: hypothetical protein BGO51_11430 [Rhodospirillales bacterium 69-11]|nr:MAG: hypothetical protein BGO51_11430 [Rhodospirillales bacterium 69-11]
MPHTPLVCIIDDDPSVRSATSSLVRSFGYAVCAFDSAEAFLAERARLTPACIICDVQMPGLSGIDLHDRLTAAGDRPPIVFITAFSQEKVRQRAGQDTVILGKPFAAEALADCLSRFAPH